MNYKLYGKIIIEKLLKITNRISQLKKMARKAI